MFAKPLTVAAGITLGMLAASSAQAVGPSGFATPLHPPQTITVRQPRLAPYAFVQFCIANAVDCRKSDGQSVIPLTRDLLRQLRQVNFEVNRAIVPQYDRSGDDEWQADVAAGDCEDYALTKRRHLIELGWSANAVRLAIAYTPDNSGHAVLVVSTDQGDLVLDNRDNTVRDWRETDLRWVMIQSSQNPMFWNDI